MCIGEGLRNLNLPYALVCKLIGGLSRTKPDALEAQIFIFIYFFIMRRDIN